MSTYTDTSKNSTSWSDSSKNSSSFSNGSKPRVGSIVSSGGEYMGFGCFTYVAGITINAGTPTAYSNSSK